MPDVSLCSRILSLSSEQWEATERFHVEKSTMIKFAFGNDYSDCSTESRVRMGVGRIVGRLCNHPGKRDADDVC